MVGKQETVLNVEMSCGGCSSAVSRILKKVDGVDQVSANLDDQSVTVTHSDMVSSETVLDALKK
eukprot:CAMPEP_0203785590 /NCGR_PEP_ID=MMETSP0100_2-20121128/1118_1 /ASSEMBLY_ACC=CAM_ASM_000210 /TAXON_ID=96639 /ORGANISM=" , Strain NY0313808BC1" /LENGTH=63 /DNA_ID=CAMNT_0050687723 /DNA_START=879 /DNA_END=1067 /DNA_ORIENTATION=-